VTFQILLFASIFLVVFLIALISFYFWKKSKAATAPIPESPFIVESGRLEVADEDICEDAVLEEISANGGSLFWRPFAVSCKNPELLSGIECGVIYEHNGIHYINDDAFIIDKNAEKKLNNDFVKLVESVVTNG